MGDNKLSVAIGFTIALNSFVAVASYNRWQEGAVAAIVATVVVLVLVYLNRIQGRSIPIYLFAVSLALMWQASIFGAHVIGSDMHGEYYASSVIASEGSWDFARHYGTQSSTSIVVGAFAPLFSNLTTLDIVWIYKAVLPFVFALTPVVLYFIYRQFIGDKPAFYSALFFMVVPITTLEIVQIGKSMVAEFFMALALLCVVMKANKPWKAYESIQAIAIFSITAMLCHYTVGIALLAYLAGIALIKYIPRLKMLSNKALPVLVLPVVALLLGASGWFYYSIADQGSIAKVMARLVPAYSHLIANTATDVASDMYLVKPTDPNEVVNDPDSGYFDKQEVLVKTGIGMDFTQATIPGKVFRIVQYLTQLLICVGGVALFWLYKKYRFTAEFVAGVWASYLLLAMCVFVPQFSNIINLTRFYHFALFFLAPMFVMGASVLLRKEGALVVAVLVYFAFTSGAVFELTGSNNINQIDTPYSVGLSAERTGVVATYTTDDVMAVEWLRDNAELNAMIVGDYNGWHLVSAYLGLDRLREDKALYNPTFGGLPDKPCYIFVTDWNSRHGVYIDSLRSVRGGAGLRGSYPLPELDYPVVFQSGSAVIYEKGE